MCVSFYLTGMEKGTFPSPEFFWKNHLRGVLAEGGTCGYWIGFMAFKV